MIPTEETFLDPKFWQALGRALGWSAGCDLAIIGMHGEEECQRYRGYYWMFAWHRFIQALADGSPPDAFFAQLPSSQRTSSGTRNPPQAGRGPSRARAAQKMHELQQTLDHICAFAQQACTKAEIVRQTTQATRTRCQQTRHRRAMMRQRLHGSSGYGRRHPEGRPYERWKPTSADREGTPTEMMPLTLIEETRQPSHHRQDQGQQHRREHKRCCRSRGERANISTHGATRNPRREDACRA
jgi:hypothetical protein